MKKTLTIVLAIVMVMLALTACSGKSDTADKTDAGKSQEELLQSAQEITQEDLQKSIDNVAFAKTLIGNVYTFCGEIAEVKENYAIIIIKVKTGENSEYKTNTLTMQPQVYLPAETLATLEPDQRINFVGELTDVQEQETGDGYTLKLLEFKNAAVVSDRFEITGTLKEHYALAESDEHYGYDAWGVAVAEDNNKTHFVFFTNDASAYEGKSVKISARIINNYYVDAEIVE